MVLLGHSMGGLVIKKAYMLAHQEVRSLADRVRAIYFLGTPHRGSDSARLLKNILQVAASAPAFVPRPPIHQRRVPSILGRRGIMVILQDTETKNWRVQHPHRRS